MLQDLRLNTSKYPERLKEFENSLNIAGSFRNDTFKSYVNSKGPKRGVAIIVRNNNHLLDAKVTYESYCSNALVLSITIYGARYHLASIYGPNEQDESFFKELDNALDNIQKKDHGVIILAGDWNCVLSYTRPPNNPDLLNSKIIPGKQNAKYVRQIIGKYNLVDTFRQTNGQRRAYTYGHYSSKRPARSRLDFFLSSELPQYSWIPTFTSQVLPKTSLIFDHQPVILKLEKKVKIKKLDLVEKNLKN